MKKESALDMALAEQILSNVFIACGRENSTISLSVLTSYSNYRKERFVFQRSFASLMLALFLLLPVLFISAVAMISRVDSANEFNPTYKVDVSGVIPDSGITATVGGKNVVVTSLDEGGYLLQPTGNGEMEVNVTLINGQRVTVTETVQGVDVTAPGVVSTEFDSESIYLYIEDDISGVDFESVAVNGETSGFEIMPEEGCVKIPYPRAETEVRVSDICGNVLTVKLKPHAKQTSD